MRRSRKTFPALNELSRAIGIALAALSIPNSFLRAQEASQVVYAEMPAVWFEAHRVGAVISPDGRLAALPIRWPDSLRFVDLHRGTVARIAPWPRLDTVSAAVFTNSSGLVFRGWRGGEWGWYTRDGSAVRRQPIPADADSRWSKNGTIAYTRRRPYFGRPVPDSMVYVQTGDSWRSFRLGGRVTGLAWLPEGRALLALTSDVRGVSTLSRLDVASGAADVVAGDLDADPIWSPVAVDGNGRRAFVALAGPTAAAPGERHVPDADRDLDLYEIDLASGSRRAIVATPAEEYAPSVAGDQLYWTTSESEMSVAVGPTAGGRLQDVVAGAMLPSWRPDGRALGFSYGGFRAGDWVLNWDGGVVEVDSVGRASHTKRPLNTGWHEDFGPVWSPRGRWIAYHSHRSTTPSVLYAGPGTTDDIWLRPIPRRDGESVVEIRLTEGEHEAGPPDWSPDGTRILFTASLPNGGRGRSFAGVISIDTITGRLLERTRLQLGPITSAEKVAWSPVSEEIAIQAMEAPGRHAIWLVRANGANPRRLVQYGTHTYSGVDWTPDGRTIIYAAIVDGRMQLFSIPAAGGTSKQLTHDEWNVLHPTVSPDGRLVAATRIRNRKAITRLRLSADTVQSASDHALRAIDAARRRFEEAIRSNDAAAMTDVYAPDAFFFPPRRDPVGGRDAIRRSLERASRDYEIVHVVHEVDVQGDLAYEIGRWIQRRRPDSTAIGGGGYLWIWKRQPDSRWAIWREVWNDGPALPSTGIGQAAPARPFGTLREQADTQQRWLAARMATVLPALMRKYAVDMWVIPMREYNEDPVFTSIVSPTTFAARRRTIYVFSMRGDSVERIALGGSSQGGVYTAIRSTKPASEPVGGTPQRNAELWGDEQWQALKKVIEERNPRNIAVNVSRVTAFSDGLSAGEMEGMREALGEKWTGRFVRHDGLALDLIATRLPEEAAFYRSMQEVVWAIIDTAFSNKVITPGVTRTDDVVWWFRQRVNDLALGSWFQPSVSIQRRGILDDNLGPNPVIQRGDVLHCDFGIVALRLATDTQHMGYVLREGETAPPAGLVAALRTGNRLQDIVMEEVKPGRTGNEVLKSSLARMRAEKIDGTVYTHPIGMHGHGAGPLIGLWDYQDGVPGRGDTKIIPSMWFSIELQATSPVPEWNGQRVRMALEEDMTIDASSKNAWALRRQTEFHLIR